jgi:hypothetical protein
MKSKYLLLTALLLPVLAGGTSAQIMYGQPSAADLQFIYTHWDIDAGDSLGEASVDQMSFPLRGFIPAGDNAEMLIYLAGAWNSLDRPATDEYTLTGLGDARLQYNRSFVDDQLLLSIGLNLPSGKRELSIEDEAPVLTTLSQSYLSFPMRQFGEGFGFSIMLGGAQMLGAFRAGASAMYQYNGSYAPYEGVDDYDPGDMISFNAGIDRSFENGQIGANAILSLYTKDKLEGSEVFKQSTAVDLRLTGQYGNDNGQLSGTIGYLVRGRNTTFVENTEEEVKIYGNELWGRAGYMYGLGKWRLGPVVELRNIAENEQDLGSATIFGGGAAISRSLGETMGFELSGRYYTGEADGGDLDLTGYQLVMSLTANF